MIPILHLDITKIHHNSNVGLDQIFFFFFDSEKIVFKRYVSPPVSSSSDVRKNIV